MMTGSDGGDGRSLIQVGWVLPRGESEEVKEVAREAMGRLRDDLVRRLPDFEWRLELVERRLTRRDRQLDPLQLLELGVQEKIERRWDFAIVASSGELLARERPFLYGVPSSALETAVLALPKRDGGGGGALIDPAAVARFLLASMLGLATKEEGAMRPPFPNEEYLLDDFSSDEQALLEERLRDVGDERLEESGKRFGRTMFKLRTFGADPRGILRDVVGYRPWGQPFRLSRLTAAAFLSSLLLFLGAEVWELGIGISRWVLVAGTVLAIFASAWFLKTGQNLSEVTRHSGLSEQVARTELVLAICLLVGMATLWLMLWGASFGLATLLPRRVIEGWIGGELSVGARAAFAAFVSTLGTLAGALGGNLEDEGDFKARFFFDEEV